MMPLSATAAHYFCLAGRDYYFLTASFGRSGDYGAHAYATSRELLRIAARFENYDDSIKMISGPCLAPERRGTAQRRRRHEASATSLHDGRMLD